MKNRKHEPWLNIFQNSRALIFFGVPNLGMSFEELAMMVDGKESEQLVRDLLVDKDNDPRPLLQKLNDDFVDCIQDRDVEVLCYYETQLSQPILKEVNLTSKLFLLHNSYCVESGKASKRNPHSK